MIEWMLDEDCSRIHKSKMRTTFDITGFPF